jgi:L-gulono-1,4-lactone dehydrogenase
VTAASWRNWAGNQVAHPRAVHQPSSEDELSAIVKRAGADAATVKVVGRGHSFTDIACTDGHLVDLARYTRVIDVDVDTQRVTVEAGIPLERLNLELEARGLALPNLGDIAYQTVAGATQTGTHGTGARLGGLATQIVGMRLVLADGSVLDCSADEHADVFAVARVGLGALGIVSQVTLQCVPAFHLHAIERPMRVDAVVEELDELVAANDHFEFFWVPHTGWALTKANNRTDVPLSPRGRFAYWRDKQLLENHAFGLVCRVGRRRPAWIPRLARALPASGTTEYVEPSYRVFASPRRVRFLEMEYAIPREACAPALRAVRQLVDDAGLLLNFPVEVRFTAPDDIALSTAFGRQSAYLAVHVFQGMDEERYFRGVERIMDDHDGRPHWGKLHFQTADTLAGRYTEWDRFLALRDRLDPERRFANGYTRRVLGD